LTIIIMANQRGSKPSSMAMGLTMGTMIMMMPIQSMNIPRMKTMTMMMIKAPHLPPGMAMTRAATTWYCLAEKIVLYLADYIQKLPCKCDLR